MGWLTIALLLLVACRPSVSTLAVTPPRVGHVEGHVEAGLVAVIVMENQSPKQVEKLPYTQQLERQGVFLSNYQVVAHPSLPNYLALTSGSTWGVKSDAYRVLPNGPDLGGELTAAHVPWRAYMEGMSNGCQDSPYPYAVKHNPFAFYGGRCPSEVVPFTSFDSDFDASDPPRFVWITPNMCDDDHDCAPAVGDHWLSGVVPQLEADPGYQHHGLIAIVWDEGVDSSNHTAALLLSPDLKSHRSTHRWNDYSVLAAVEDRLGVRRLGGAIDADPFASLLE